MLHDYESERKNQEKFYQAIFDAFSKFVEKAHKGQFRRDGETPYFTHLKRVADKFGLYGLTNDNELKKKLVGVGHDLREDTKITQRELRELKLNLPEFDNREYDLPKEVSDAIEVLTKDKYEDYSEFIERVKNNSLAREVKVVDILDNLSDSPTNKQIIKYAKALLELVEND